MDTNLSTKVFKNLHKIKYFPNKCVVRPFNERIVSATLQGLILLGYLSNRTLSNRNLSNLIYCNKAQFFKFWPIFRFHPNVHRVK